MAYIIIELGGDFQQGGYLYELTSDIQWITKYLWMSGRLYKQALEKQTNKLLGIVLW